MKNNVLRIILIVCLGCINSLSVFSQNDDTVEESLKCLPNTLPPYSNAKWVEWGELASFPNFTVGISDAIYNDLQCRTVIFHAYNNIELRPILYLKSVIPNTEYTLGAVTFGGATDAQIDRLFISNQAGKVTSSLDAFVGVSNVTVLQFKLTTDYKVITYRLVPTSSKTIMYNEILGRDKSSKTVECYRLDTTYRINSSGQFEKESEQKHPVKAYTVKEMYEKNVWEL